MRENVLDLDTQQHNWSAFLSQILCLQRGSMVWNESKLITSALMLNRPLCGKSRLLVVKETCLVFSPCELSLCSCGMTVKFVTFFKSASGILHFFKMVCTFLFEYSICTFTFTLVLAQELHGLKPSSIPGLAQFESNSSQF